MLEATSRIALLAVLAAAASACSSSSGCPAVVVDRSAATPVASAGACTLFAAGTDGFGHLLPTACSTACGDPKVNRCSFEGAPPIVNEDGTCASSDTPTYTVTCEETHVDGTPQAGCDAPE